MTIQRSAVLLLVVVQGGCMTPTKGHAPPSNGVREFEVEADINSSEASRIRRLRLANLNRADKYPWTDDGRCAVRESSGDWATLVENCYDDLDLKRIKFTNPPAVCALAQASAISLDEVQRLVGICVLVQPELIEIGAVIIVGIVLAKAIQEAVREISCDDHFTKCLDTDVADIPGPLWGHSQCHACRDVCVQNGGVWPSKANGKRCL